MGITRLLILGIVGFILYKLVSNEIRKRSAESKQPETGKTFKEPTGNMVKDPVCGTYVDAATSISVRDGAQVHRFCGYECRDSFLEQLRATGRNIPKETDTEKSSHSGNTD